MELLLLRNHPYGDGISGRLFVNGAFSCFTVEPLAQEEDGEAIEHPAIAEGEFEFVLEDSLHYGPNTMTIKVPGRTGIRVHKGNKPSDSKGCLLVGDALANELAGPRIAGGTSRPALERLHTAVLKATARGERHTILVQTAESQ